MTKRKQANANINDLVTTEYALKIAPPKTIKNDTKRTTRDYQTAPDVVFLTVNV
jgi:hypothetical protein